MTLYDTWGTMNGATRIVDAQDARIGTGAAWSPGNSLVNVRGGLRPGPGDPFAVAATGTPGSSVTVQPGQIVIPASRGLGAYPLTSDAVITLPILDLPADPSSQRNDLVVARQSDTYYGDATTAPTIAVVRGNPGSGDPSPTTGGLSPDYYVLARVRIPAGTAAITNALIDDLRPDQTVALGGILEIGSQAKRDALPVWRSRTIYRSDRGWIEIHDGTAWRVQGTAVCASTADRDSAITHPINGQLATTTDHGILWLRHSGAWIRYPGSLLARRVRTATMAGGSASTTAVGVLRIDGISVRAGQAITVRTGTLHPDSSVNTDTIRVEIRYSTSGAATVASPILPGAQAYELWGNTTSLESATYVPGAAQTLSLILCVARAIGTGTAKLYIDSDRVAEVKVYDDGRDPGNTGVDL